MGFRDEARKILEKGFHEYYLDMNGLVAQTILDQLVSLHKEKMNKDILLRLTVATKVRTIAKVGELKIGEYYSLLDNNVDVIIKGKLPTYQAKLIEKQPKTP